MATPFNLSGHLRSRAGILASRGRLRGLGIDHQFSTSRLAVRFLTGEELYGIKFRRSAVTKCSPSTISEGRGRGIIGTLYRDGRRRKSCKFFTVRRTS